MCKKEEEEEEEARQRKRTFVFCQVIKNEKYFKIEEKK
jgi:hypothetical protein